MCVGAIVHARIGRLVYGAPEPKTGAVQSTLQLLDDPSWNHRVTVVAGLLAEESRGLMREFFEGKRGKGRGVREEGRGERGEGREIK
jgi:tRNA(adenine34) deaminase